MATASSLPPELLLQIFLYFLLIPSPTKNWNRPTVRHSKQTFSNPIILTHICQHWRNVAISFPDLWTNIFILGPGSTRLLLLISLWLSRAEGYALTIQFVEKHFHWLGRHIDDNDVDGGNHHHRQATELTSTLLSDTLWKFRSYWDEIDFEFTDNIDTNDNHGILESTNCHRMLITKEMPGDDALDVHTARIIDRPRWNSELTGPLWWRIVYSPSLVNLEVGALYAGPPHAGLQELVCHKSMPLTQVAQLLFSCPQLIKINVTIKGTNNEMDDEIPEDADIVCSHLKELVVLNSEDIRVIPLTLLEALTCPVLEHLDVGYIDYEPTFHETLFEFLDRSAPPLLKTLKGVAIAPMPEPFLVRFLSLPILQSLTVLKASLATPFFHRILTRLPPAASLSPSLTQPPPLLHHLNHLELENMLRCDWEFSNMILSRMNTLTKVEVRGNQSLGSVPFSQELWKHPDLTVKIAKPYHPHPPPQGNPLPAGPPIFVWYEQIKTKREDRDSLSMKHEIDTAQQRSIMTHPVHSMTRQSV